MQSAQKPTHTLSVGKTETPKRDSQKLVGQTERRKRRRVDMQESSHHKNHNHNHSRHETPRPPPNLRVELKKMCQEVEPVVLKRREIGLPAVTCNRPTYRAQLAKRGYLVRETLGSGSYSKVKMAVDFTGVARRVAVKIVDRIRAPRDYQDKFMPRELEIWPALKHPNLVELREWFENSKRVFMVLEYAEGGDVLKYIQSVGAINEKLARRWTLEVANAIKYLHQQDITHRDLKLENLLLDINRNIKICDFGFIKGSSSRELSQTYCGSKSYAAPEILLGRPYDPKKADIWAIGVILYIFVTGKMPFDESRGTKHILEEQRRLAFPWSELRKVSAKCKALIHKLFTWKFPVRPTIQEILEDDWFSSLAASPGGACDGESSRGFPVQVSLSDCTCTKSSTRPRTN